MNNYKVYQHKRKDTNEIFYIGIGKRSDRPKQTIGRNKWWKRIVEKHGFIVEILFENLSKIEACTKEIELIKFYGRKDLGTGNLVNMTGGGEGTKKWSLELREILRQSRLGKITSKETLIKLSGENSPRSKKVIDTSTMQIYSNTREAAIANNILPKTLSKWLRGERKNLSFFEYYLDSDKKIPKKDKSIEEYGYMKKVSQYSLKGDFIKNFNTIKEAEEYMGRTKNSNKIRYCALGKSKTAYGFIWKY